MKLIKLTLVHEYINKVLYFKNIKSAKAFLSRALENYKMETIFFKVKSKQIYSVRSVGNFARNVGDFSTLKEARQKSQNVGQARPGAYSDIHSYPILTSFKQVKDNNSKFIGDYSRSAIE